MAPLLYHFPPSPYSMRVRLALEEKGVSWDSRIVDIVGRRENYAPWYVRLHPGAVVPLLVDGAQVIAESVPIVRFVDARYPGPPLTPEDPEERGRMEAWFTRALAFSLERVHAATTPPRLSRMESRALASRAKALRSLEAAHPDLASIYRAKRLDMEQKSAIAGAPEPRALVLAFVEGELDALDLALADHPFLAGPRWTLAEALWTPIVSRLLIIGLRDVVLDPRRPNFVRWWNALRSRPSFARADVWERNKAWVLAPFILRWVGPYLIAGALLLGALATAVWWGMHR